MRSVPLEIARPIFPTKNDLPVLSMVSRIPADGGLLVLGAPDYSYGQVKKDEKDQTQTGAKPPRRPERGPYPAKENQRPRSSPDEAGNY